MKNKILSIDVESNGLYGQGFVIAALLYSNGKYKEVYCGRCEIDGATDEWVEKNVIPIIGNIPVTNKSYKSLLEEFIDFYMKNKEGADVIVHMGFPVEAKIFIDAHNLGLIGDFDGPYPLIDISAYPEIGTSVDNYIMVNNIELSMPLDILVGTTTHNPIFDAIFACEAYIHYNSNKK